MSWRRKVAPDPSAGPRRSPTLPLRRGSLDHAVAPPGLAAQLTLSIHGGAPPAAVAAAATAPLPLGQRRRMPVASVFPIGGGLQHRQQVQTRRSLPTLSRTRSIYDRVGEEHLRTLRALFHACDGNDDGMVPPSELIVMLHLIGLPESEATQFAAQRLEALHDSRGPPDKTAPALLVIGMTFDQVLNECRNYTVACAAHTSPPPDSFLVRCKPLKQGFKKCDSDANLFVTQKELEIALQKLDLVLSDAELSQLTDILDRNKDGKIEWSDFLYAAWNNSLSQMDEGLHNHPTIDIFADPPVFLRPVTVARYAGPRGEDAGSAAATGSAAQIHSSPHASAIDSRRSSLTGSIPDEKPSSVSKSNSQSRLERMGSDFLTRVSMQHVTQAKRSTSPAISQNSKLSRRDLTKTRTTSLSRAASSRRRGGRRSGFSSAVRHQIVRIEATAIIIAALTGILCGLVSTWLEAMIPTNLVESHSEYVYYVCVALINIAVSIFEVNGMYLTAVVCAFRLIVCTNLKLCPQDAERAFLTRAIARAALQVGHRKDKIFGIDLMKGSPRLVLFLTYIMFKGKRYVLKFLLKLLIKRVLWRAAAKSVLSLIVLPINGVMNAWSLRNVMLNCRVSIIGPPCAIDVLEVFFLEDDSFSPQQRVDYICALGCSLVCKWSAHPNLEVMLDHMRHRWITPELWPASEGCICASNSQETCPVHLLDDIDRFIVSLELYASKGDANLAGGLAMRQYIHNVLFLLIVALVIDGKLDWVERRLYSRVCHATKVQARWTDILRLKDDFVKGKGIHVDAVHALIVEIDHSEANARVPLREALAYLWNHVSGLLT